MSFYTFDTRIIAFAIAVVLLKMPYSNQKLLCGCIVAFLLIAGLLSVSRMYFGALIWPLLLIIKMVLSGKDTKKILPVVMLFIIVGAVMWNSISPMVTNVLNRFNSETTSGGNGRFDAWFFYLNNWKQSISSLLFGLGTRLELYVDYRGAITVQHNFYIESLTEIGIIGTTAMFLCFVELYHLIVTSGRKIVNLIPVLTALTCYIFLNALFSETSGFILLIGFIVYESINRSEMMVNN